MILVNLYLVVFTPYWPVSVLMLTWLAFDWRTPERGEGPARAALPPTTRPFFLLLYCGQFRASLQPDLVWAGEGEGRGSFQGASEAQIGTGVG